MKTNYKHTHWLRVAALRVITLMAFLIALPGFAKAQTANDPLDVSNCADKVLTLTYQSGWFYSWTGQNSTPFNGTLTGTVVTNQAFTIKSAIDDQVTLTIDNARIEANGAFPIFYCQNDGSLTIQINDSELTAKTDVFTASSEYAPVIIRTGGTKPSKMTSTTSTAISLKYSDLTIDGGTQGLMITSSNYAISAALKNRTIKLTGKILMTQPLQIVSTCTLTVGEDVQAATKSSKAFDISSSATVTYEHPIIQWTYSTAPAAGTLTIKKKGTEKVATFTTDGNLKSFGIGAEADKTYTVWYQPTGGKQIRQIDKNSINEFKVSENKLLSFIEMKNDPNAPVYDWAFDATDNTIASEKQPIRLNVTAMGNKLAINGSHNDEDEELDLSGAIADKDGNEYEIVSISDNAFAYKKFQSVTLPATLTTLGKGAFKDAAISQLHLLHENASAIANIGDDALALGNKNSCIVYVPKGKLTSGGYYKDNTTNNWQGFPYIMEEEGQVFDLTYKMSQGEIVDENVDFPDFRPASIPVGQNFCFKMTAKDKTLGLKVAAKEGDNVKYDSETGIVTISDQQTKNLELDIQMVGPITVGDRIIVTADGTYKDGESGVETAYSNCFGNGKDPLTIKELMFDNTAPIFVTMKNLTINDGVIVNDKANATITFEGDNGIYNFAVANGGSLTLEKKEDIAATIKYLTGTNEGIFKDETGQISLIYATADNDQMMLDKDASSAAKEYVQSGGKVILKASAMIDTEDLSLTYQWQLQNATDKTWENVVEPAITKSSGVAYGQSQTFEVSAENAGQYRCLVTCTKSASNVTTLTHYTTVEVKSTTPTPPPYIPTYYNVNLTSVEGATTTPQAGMYVTEEGYNFSFTLILEKGYKNSTPVVKANGVVITPRESDGKYIIRNIFEDIHVVIEGVMKDNPTGNAEIDGVIKVQAVAGILYIYLPQNKTVSIYTASGLLYKETKLAAGDNRMELTRGLYFVKIASKTYKVAIR